MSDFIVVAPLAVEAGSQLSAAVTLVGALLRKAAPKVTTKSRRTPSTSGCKA